MFQPRKVKKNMEKLRVSIVFIPKIFAEKMSGGGSYGKFAGLLILLPWELRGMS